MRTCSLDGVMSILYYLTACGWLSLCLCPCLSSVVRIIHSVTLQVSIHPSIHPSILPSIHPVHYHHYHHGLPLLPLIFNHTAHRTSMVGSLSQHKAYRVGTSIVEVSCLLLGLRVVCEADPDCLSFRKPSSFPRHSWPSVMIMRQPCTGVCGIPELRYQKSKGH